MAIATLISYAEAGRSWVAVDDRDRAVGYVVVDIIDGFAHVQQISVDPGHEGQGLGRALLDAVERWAATLTMSALTLTTFDHVPWNRPLYEHLGFVVLDEDDLQVGLRAIRDAETEHGLDPAVRVCMRRVVEHAAHVAS